MNKEPECEVNGLGWMKEMKCATQMYTERCRVGSEFWVGGLAEWMGGFIAPGLIVGEQETLTHRAKQATQVVVSQKLVCVCVFDADPYTLTQHFLNLSSVFFGHK